MRRVPASQRGLVARVVASLAVGGNPSDLQVLPPHYRKAVTVVADLVAYQGGVCPLCRRGGFTPRGYYLHLSSVHSEELERLVAEVAERLVGG